MPAFLVYIAAFMGALFICVCLHLFIRSRSLIRPRGPVASKSEAIDPSNCFSLIQNQITLIQTFPHPSPAGRQNTERLSELLLAARLYYPSSKAPLTAFAERMPMVYDDEGLFLMAILDLRKWVTANLQTPELT